MNGHHLQLPFSSDETKLGWRGGDGNGPPHSSKIDGALGNSVRPLSQIDRGYSRRVLVEAGEDELRVPLVDRSDAAADPVHDAPDAAAHVEAVEAVRHGHDSGDDGGDDAVARRSGGGGRGGRGGRRRGGRRGGHHIIRGATAAPTDSTRAHSFSVLTVVVSPPFGYYAYFSFERVSCHRRSATSIQSDHPMRRQRL